MGLKNISEKEISIKYSGKNVVIAPGGIADVRDFGVKLEDVIVTERLLKEKYQGVDIVKTKSLEDINAELKQRIIELEAKVAELEEKPVEDNEEPEEVKRGPGRPPRK